ncbi:MAG: MATE family efflux transporter [Gemmatales bacterium]|nr:MATE family efflux transporter [Gemmatales bacterium]MDW7994764.1 MATE family efflux transporter [Gemmatales bacterium]
MNEPSWWTLLKELLRVAGPLVISSGCWTIELALDRMFLSWYHPLAVGAAVQSAMVFWAVFVLPYNCIGYVGTFVAQYHGAGKVDRQGPVVWQGLYLAMLVGLIALAWLPFAQATVDWLGHEAQLRQWEREYLICLIVSALPTLVVAAISGFFAGRGETWAVLAINLVSVITNLVLDYALIFGHWGLAELGVVGAGIATVIAAIVSAMLALGLFWRNKYREYCGTWQGRAIEVALLRRLLRYGLPAGLQWWFDSLAWTVFLVVIGWMGAEELSATSVAFAINSVAFVPMLGLGQAISVLVGQHLGENRPGAASQVTWIGFGITWLYMSVVAGLYYWAPGIFVDWFYVFTSDKFQILHMQARVRELTCWLLQFVALYCLFDSMNIVFSSALRGAGDTVYITWMSAGLAVPVLIVPSWLAWYYDWGLGVAWGFATGYVIVLALVFLGRFLGGKWRTMRVIEWNYRSPEGGGF